MARSGYERGFNQAYLQGVKSGHAMGSARTGFASGFTDGAAYPNKLQNPVFILEFFIIKGNSLLNLF